MQAKPIFHFSAGAVFIAVAGLTQCFAQPPAPATSRVTFTHVKPDMLTEWMDLQKNEVIPALKKAGIKTQTVYATSLFGNAFEFATVVPFEKYADFDDPSPLTRALTQAGAARLNEKLRKCILSANSFSSTSFPELSNVVEGSDPPAVSVFVRYRIAPGKMADYQSLVKSELLPVYKKAKVNFAVSQRGLGANTGDVVSIIGFAKYADLDGGTVLIKQLGQEGAAKVNAKFAGIRTLIEVVVRRRVPELSF